MATEHRGRTLSILIFIEIILLISVNQIAIGDDTTSIWINEVLYNPTQDENYNEWIELYNPTDQPIDISGWSITDNSAQDFLEADTQNGDGTTIILAYGYAIIADQGTRIYENFSIPDSAIKLCVDDASIGNGLGNSEDKLILKNNAGEIIDSIEWGEDYLDIPGSPTPSVNEGHSLCRYPSQDTDDTSKDFCETVTPTPGDTNVVSSEPEETPIEPEPFGPDLMIPAIKCSTSSGEETTIFGEGNIITIKATLKNQGNQNATNVDVVFYYDAIASENYIDTKHYDSVEKYQKYPSVQWDTHEITPGDHMIIAIVDPENFVEESDETNNEQSFQMTLMETTTIPSGTLLITELYYDTHPRMENEFITVYNPTDQPIDISGLALTNQPQERTDEQTKIVFPPDIIIPQKTGVTVTYNASAYQREAGKYPEFEYGIDSLSNIPQMIAKKTFTLSNTGGAIAIKDPYNHTIDLVIYGNYTTEDTTGWNGPPLKKTGQGIILKRTFNGDTPRDTDTADDFTSNRRYHIGQSTFSFAPLSIDAEITTFVSPDSSFTAIVNELQSAKESIYCNLYEFTNPFLCDELIAALQRNIKVYLFLEGFPIGGIDDREKYIVRCLATHGADVRFLMNNPDAETYARYPYDHAKYIVIDNKTVIVESCNWAKTGVPKDPTTGNREWGIIIRNDIIAQQFLTVFLDDWNPERCDSYPYDMMNFYLPQDFFMDLSTDKGSYTPMFSSKTFTGTFTVTPVFSPDTSEQTINDLIDCATTSIYIEQLYVYTQWGDMISPFVERLVNKSRQGVDVKIILNYNAGYDATNEEANQTKQYCEQEGISVKLLYTNWSYFTNVHNKGMIVDNKYVLISSINWNENSVRNNREAGIVVENEDVARYYTEVFMYDWNLQPSQHTTSQNQGTPFEEHKNIIYIIVIFTLVFLFIAYDWRKRKWT